MLSQHRKRYVIKQCSLIWFYLIYTINTFLKFMYGMTTIVQSLLLAYKAKQRFGLLIIMFTCSMLMGSKWDFILIKLNYGPWCVRNMIVLLMRSRYIIYVSGNLEDYFCRKIYRVAIKKQLSCVYPMKNINLRKTKIITHEYWYI